MRILMAVLCLMTISWTAQAGKKLVLNDDEYHVVVRDNTTVFAVTQNAKHKVKVYQQVDRRWTRLSIFGEPELDGMKIPEVIHFADQSTLSLEKNPSFKIQGIRQARIMSYVDPEDFATLKSLDILVLEPYDYALNSGFSRKKARDLVRDHKYAPTIGDLLEKVEELKALQFAPQNRFISDDPWMIQIARVETEIHEIVALLGAPKHKAIRLGEISVENYFAIHELENLSRKTRDKRAKLVEKWDDLDEEDSHGRRKILITLDESFEEHGSISADVPGTRVAKCGETF